MYRFVYSSQQMDENEKIRLYWLPTYFKLLMDLIDIQIRPPIIHNDFVNELYVELTIWIEDSLNTEYMKNNLNDIPKLYTSLYGDMNELPTEWEFDRGEYFNFYVRLKKLADKLITPEDMFNFGSFETQRKLEDKVKEYIILFSSNKEKRLSLPKFNIEDVRLTPKSYDAASGILMFGGVQVLIAKQLNMKGPGTKEQKQPMLMRKLFKDVNTMSHGLKFASATSEVMAKLSTANKKNIKSRISEINYKVAISIGVSDCPPPIIFNQERYMIDSRYL